MNSPHLFEATKPAVTVISIFFNRTLGLKKCVESLITQNYKPIKVVLIDDGSTDETLKALMQYAGISNIEIITQKNIGFTNSIIKAVERANTKYVAIHGSGDISHADRIEKQVALLESNDSYGFCGSASVNVSAADGRPLDYQKYNTIELNDNDFFQSPPFTHGTVVFRKDLYDSIGGYDNRFKYSQDWDLWLRFTTKSKGIFINEILYTRTVDIKGASFDIKKAEEQLFFKHLALSAHKLKEPERNKIISYALQDRSIFNQKIKSDLCTRLIKLRGMGLNEEANQLLQIITSRYSAPSLPIRSIDRILKLLISLGIRPSYLLKPLRFAIELRRNTTK